eukprot:SAG11_NODE_10664_length_813_cov_1.634454_1_plen_85_part_10
MQRGFNPSLRLAAARLLHPSLVLGLAGATEAERRPSLGPLLAVSPAQAHPIHLQAPTCPLQVGAARPNRPQMVARRRRRCRPATR